ncbi:hypothetical protein [Marinifilum fragile]|uniref:toxin-antitoxin system YwqK family antitoxin n=1 Tax=Marinifilum fragile TaxID=570161 RepID=UPI002AAAA3E1|nr:hypothetical protein [Marinifilum fragile]
MKYILSLLVIVLPLAIIAQEKEGIPMTRSVKVVEGGKQILFRVLTHKQEFKAENSKIYYWFSKGKIRQNVGGYSGDLLDGKYEMFNKEGMLLEQGTFKKGLKIGIWKNWDENGDLWRISEYVEGVKHGLEIVIKGSELYKTPYRMGKIHGSKIVEMPDTVIKVKYIDGQEQIKKAKKEKKPIFQWMKRKKDKDEPKRKQIPEQKD